jgi:sulfur-carrier protein adenylyltransferase/sulfurtransferase
VRSRAAAAILARSGFKEVYSMEGGINAWKGLVAKGVLEAGMAYFPEESKAEELIALAWLLEDGSRKFYSAMAEKNKEKEPGILFRELTKAEEEHQSSLFRIYQEISGLKTDPRFPGDLIRAKPKEDYLEGGISLQDALKWMEGKDWQDAVELSISLEVNAEDLYIKMERKVEDRKAKKVFIHLAEQEKNHLKRLTGLFEKNV